MTDVTVSGVLSVVDHVGDWNDLPNQIVLKEPLGISHTSYTAETQIDLQCDAAFPADLATGWIDGGIGMFCHVDEGFGYLDARVAPYKNYVFTANSY